ncbi:MAG: flagellar hook-length control protein FliK [Porticoccus sp.]
MEELQLALTAARVEQKNFGLWLKSWQVGQVLQALVVDKAPSGETVLRVGGHQITATVDIPVQKGAVLMLEVSSLSPIPTLKIVNASTSSVAQADPLLGKLQLLLPQQGKVVDPIMTLMASAQSANILSLLGVKSDDIDRLLKHLNRLDQLANPKLLKAALGRSGLFLESQMQLLAATGGLLPSGDLKAELLRLLHRVNRRLQKLRGDVSSEHMLGPLLNLQRELEGAIASISLDQLAACQTDDAGGCIWSFEIPVRFKDSVESLLLTISRESDSANIPEERQDWKATLSVTLPVLGMIEAELFLRGQKVSVVIYSEDDTTTRFMDSHLGQLKTGLESRGLDVSVLLCRQGSHLQEKNRVRLTTCLDEQA